MTESEGRVVLVTGGSGLVGSGIKAVVEEEARPNETWIFLSSKVKFCETCHLFLSAIFFIQFFLFPKLVNTNCLHRMPISSVKKRHKPSLRSTSQPM